METLVGLLQAGWQIRLLSRICEIPSQPNLHWIRISTPRRPFVAAFPLFAIVASVLLAARRSGRSLTVTLGAIVPNRVDVVVVQFCQAAFATRGIRRTTRTSPVHRAHSWLSKWLALGLERWCYRADRVAAMTAVSPVVRHELLTHYRLASVPIDVIPNGVDLARFHPNPAVRQAERSRLGLAPDDLAAIFVGGDWSRKGLDVAMRAAARAQWTLIVAGHGDVEAWSRRARECGARVIFSGHVVKPENALRAADAFMLPSSYEGFALVTIEAAATGLPLLVTEATGAAALAERSGVNVLPCEAESFAAELRRLGSDSALRREVGVKAREAAAEYAWPRIVAAYARACDAADPITA
jgi:glycosyltransferase involved in cell wall biosynthesis